MLLLPKLLITFHRKCDTGGCETFHSAHLVEMFRFSLFLNLD